MPEKDPNHWLYRLDADEWLSAADNELQAGRAAFFQKQQRTAVTHARRAGGMALNALLWHTADERYGRSYMDHLQALAKDEGVSGEVRAAAANLVGMPMTQQLVTLGPHGDAGQIAPAALIIEHVRRLLKPAGHA